MLIYIYTICEYIYIYIHTICISICIMKYYKKYCVRIKSRNYSQEYFYG